MSVAVCWLRRNLRVDDNAALAAALRHADAVVPAFALDDFYLTEDVSPPRLAVLAGSLKELAAALTAKGSRLIVRRGPPAEALAALCRETGADAVFGHRDHEPHAKELETAARAALGRIGARLHLVEDLLLVPAGSLATEAGRPYTVYTPFARRWLERDKEPPVPEPAALPTPDLVLRPDFPSIPLEKPRGFRETGAPDNPRGGAREARRLWDAFRAAALPGYARERDRPDRPGTSRLSPHLRFGTIGVRRLLAEARELWRAADAAGKASVETFVKELAWREFYASILESFPQTATANFRAEFDRFPWAAGEEETRRFAAWAEGRTGYPIVDAGMRQLLREGWMHNRVRMIVASFLTKDLLVDWRKGEAFFRRHLADGDLASNSGGWQWAAGSGTDAQPFFRIFNPVLQGQKFDPDGAYVRRWLPELSAARTGRPAEIHAPWKLSAPPPDYPAPVVDHAAARARALAAFAAVRA
ncbi:MAG TPA: deoxyribodipyrimidine photo-lyase [Thermoanaerobaculia bacterium]|nr:deoxyribodipyrimidine photo-lyase [Thermoanaerobaculia bacterium]